MAGETKLKKADPLTLIDLLTGKAGPPLNLVLQVGQMKTALPRTSSLWNAQMSSRVVSNKKPIQMKGRNGRYSRYRLLVGSFFLAESKLKEPLLVSGGKGIIPAGHIVFSPGVAS